MHWCEPLQGRRFVESVSSSGIMRSRESRLADLHRTDSQSQQLRGTQKAPIATLTQNASAISQQVLILCHSSPYITTSLRERLNRRTAQNTRKNYAQEWTSFTITLVPLFWYFQNVVSHKLIKVLFKTRLINVIKSLRSGMEMDLSHLTTVNWPQGKLFNIPIPVSSFLK